MTLKSPRLTKIQKRFFFLSLLLLLALSCAVYKMFFYTQYKVEYIPEKAEKVLFINTQKLKREWISEFITHPQEWKFSISSQDSSQISLLKSGLEIPHIVCAFQLPHAQWNEWYALFPVKNPKKWMEFLKQEKFQSDENNFFRKKSLSFYLIPQGVIMAWNARKEFFKPEFIQLQWKSFKKTVFSKKYLDHHIAVLTDLQNPNDTDLILDLNAYEMTLSSRKAFEEKEMENSSHWLNFFLRKQDISSFPFFHFTEVDSLDFDYIKGNSSSFTPIKDSIITYDFDENFNEIEKIDIQILTEPEYYIEWGSSNPQHLLTQMQSIDWVNEASEFVKIPLNKNKVSLLQNSLSIQTPLSQKETSINFPQNSFVQIKGESIASYIKEWRFLTDQQKKAWLRIKEIEYLQKGTTLRLTILLNPDEKPLLLGL